MDPLDALVRVAARGLIRLPSDGGFSAGAVFIILASLFCLLVTFSVLLNTVALVALNSINDVGGIDSN